MSSNPCKYMDYEARDHKTADLGRVWLFGRKVKVYRAAYRLHARSVCDAKHRCSCSLRFVALYK